jgi:hypothetical protein
MLSTTRLTQLILTEADAQKIWVEHSIIREEFPTSGSLFHFVQAVAHGHAKILTR